MAILYRLRTQSGTPCLFSWQNQNGGGGTYSYTYCISGRHLIFFIVFKLFKNGNASLNSFRKRSLTQCSWFAFKCSMTTYPLICLLVNYFHDKGLWTLADLKVWRLVEIVECCGQPQGPQHQQQEQQRALPIIAHVHYRTVLRCKKKVGEFPVPSRDVTNQTLPGRE